MMMSVRVVLVFFIFISFSMSMTFRIQVCYSKYYYVFKSRENFGQTLKLDTQSNLSINL